jgi:hypothetical protein
LRSAPLKQGGRAAQADAVSNKRLKDFLGAAVRSLSLSGGRTKAGAIVDAGFSMENVELTIAVGTAILIYIQAPGNHGLAGKLRKPLHFRVHT